MFARSGYHGAEITDITTEAGRSAGSFHKHFAGKDDVLRALLADWLAQAGAELAADPAGDDLSRGAGPARPGGRLLAHLPRAPPGDPRAWRGSPGRPGLRREPRHDAARRARHHAAAPCSDCATQATPCPAIPQVLASAFNALLEGFCQAWIAAGGEPIGRPLGDEEAIDTLTRLLLYGLAGQR